MPESPINRRQLEIPFPQTGVAPWIAAPATRADSAKLDPMPAAPAQPFLKWAGGKTQLLSQFERFFPQSITSYTEPFIGGGAVFFDFQARFPNLKAALRDNNAELINCYQIVRDDCLRLMELLDDHLRRFRGEGADYFYQVRAQHDLGEPCERAARMIFLNKTCYNGLWRVNARGHFNVPIGSYRPDRVSLYDRDNLLAVRGALQSAELKIQDFSHTLGALGHADFAYIDPPYAPVSATANFTSYTKENFGQAEQEELAALFAAAARRGARLMLSNSDTPQIRSLYRDFTIHTVNARRAVNCDGARRGMVSELVVTSY